MCFIHKKPIPSQAQMMALGSLVANRFFSSKSEGDYCRFDITKDEPFKVLCYPKKYTYLIDSVIIEYFNSLPQKRVRKRIVRGSADQGESGVRYP